MSKNPAAVALGSMKSPAKALSSAENGKKGGRPPYAYEARAILTCVARGATDADAHASCCKKARAAMRAMGSNGPIAIVCARLNQDPQARDLPSI